MSTLIGAEQVIALIKLFKIINEFWQNYGEAKFNFQLFDPVKSEVNGHGSKSTVHEGETGRSEGAKSNDQVWNFTVKTT